jgi:hypothetical protein
VYFNFLSLLFLVHLSMLFTTNSSITILLSAIYIISWRSYVYVNILKLNKLYWLWLKYKWGWFCDLCPCDIQTDVRIIVIIADIIPEITFKDGTRFGPAPSMVVLKRITRYNPQHQTKKTLKHTVSILIQS